MGMTGYLLKDDKPTLVFLPREFHGQWSLAGFSPQGLKESVMTEATERMCSPFSHFPSYSFSPGFELTPLDLVTHL